MFRDGRVIAVFFTRFVGLDHLVKDEDHFDLFTLQKINMENLEKTGYPEFHPRTYNG